MNIFERADLQQLCSFIVNREETVARMESYQKEKERARDLAYQVLKDVGDKKMSYEEGLESLSESFAIHQEICMEIGMKLGAKMIHQLLLQEDKD